MKKINKSLLALTISTTFTLSAHATNADVNHFLTLAHGDNYQEAVNAYDNLNMRDQEVVKGAADLTDIHGKLLDIIGGAKALGHTPNSPQGWQLAKTLEMLRIAHQQQEQAEQPDNAKGSLISSAPAAAPSQADLQKQFAALKAAADAKGTELEQANRERTASQHADPVMVQAQRDAAQDAAAAQAQHDANWTAIKTDDNHHAIMVAQIDIDKNADDIKTNATHINTNTAAISGIAQQLNTNTSSISQLSGAVSGVAQQVETDHKEETAKNAEQDQNIAANTLALAGKVDNATYSHDNLKQLIADKGQDANIAALKGAALEEANRARTADQHVAPVVGRDGADGKDGVTTTIMQVDTATQQKVKANSTEIAKQSRTNDVQTGQIEVTNQRIDEDRANLGVLKGAALEEANRARTANQHVAPVVGHDGADGKDGKDGVTTTITKVETDTATQAEVQALKGAALTTANQARTASQHVAAPVAKDGVNGADGKDGAAGKDGVTTTVTKVQTDTATQKKVAAHDSTIRAVSAEQQAQGEFIQREAVAINQQAAVINHNAARIDDNSARIQQNSQRIDRNSKRIDETKEDLKRGLNNAAAMSSLHFDGNHNSWALSTGSANGEGAAMAGGLQKSVTDHAAVTVQFSNSFDGGYMVGAGVHGDW